MFGAITTQSRPVTAIIFAVKLPHGERAELPGKDARHFCTGAACQSACAAVPGSSHARFAADAA